MKINRHVGAKGEQQVNRPRKGCQLSFGQTDFCEGGGEQKGKEMKLAKKTDKAA